MGRTGVWGEMLEVDFVGRVCGLLSIACSTIKGAPKPNPRPLACFNTRKDDGGRLIDPLGGDAQQVLRY